MSNFHLRCYINELRPQLQHPAVTEIPAEVLGDKLALELKVSLLVDSSDGPACAASARFWETLLEVHHLPYLILRVADMRMALNSKISALALYEELRTILQDTEFDHWVDELGASMRTEVAEHLHAYKFLLVFTPSQRWQPMVEVDPLFPGCRLQPNKIDKIRDLWRKMGSPDMVMAKYQNMHCLETNTLEGTFEFHSSAISPLVEIGFYTQVEHIGDESIVGGAVRNLADALSILRDTHQALNEYLLSLNLNV